MKKNISFLVAELFKDKSVFLDMGFNGLEAEVFYYLMNGHSIAKISEILEVPLSKIRKIKDRKFHLVPIYMRRKLSYMNTTQVDKFNTLLLELNTVLKDYFLFFNNPATKQVRELNISERTINALFMQNIKTIAELAQLTIEDLSAIKNLGEKGITELQIALAQLGLALREV